MKKYKKMDIPLTAYEEFVRTQKNMIEAHKKITGKSKKVPLTKVIEIKAKQPTYLFNGELIKIFKKGKHKI